MREAGSHARRVRFRVVAGVLLLAMWQVATLAAGARFGLAGFADFRAFYGAGTIVRMGGSARLYEYELQHQVQNATVGARTQALPFVYPAYAALPFVPLTGLSYRGAYLAWMGVNAGLLGCAVRLLLPWLAGLRRLWRPLPWMLAGCFFPVGIALMQGQVSVLLLVVFCGCLAALECGRELLAGAVLALALMKFHVVLPVVLLFAVWRRWRLVGGFAAGAAGVGAVCVAMCGWPATREYVREMMEAATTGSVAGRRDDSMLASSRMPDLHGVGMALAGQAHWGTVLVVMASVAVLGWTAWRPASLARAVVAGLLVSWHLHLHDLTLLLLPLGLVWNEAAGLATGKAFGGERAAPTVRQWVVLGTAGFWVLCPLLTWMTGAGMNWVLAVAMVPLLWAESPGMTGLREARGTAVREFGWSGARGGGMLRR